MVDQAEIRWKAVSGDFKERREAVKQLRHNFANLPDKEGAWNDLIQLAMGDRSILALGAQVGLLEAQCVQLDAVDALGDVFQYIHDKKRIWKDLIRVTQSDPDDIDDGGVKWHAVCVLDAVFQQYPDKEHALKDLHRFAYDKDSYVRASANYSLGKAHIFKATETEGEEDFRKELNNALNFFEKSSNETDYFNPSSFCLPFYRSFYTITFEKARAEDEVRKYLAEAKSASEGSQSKEQLLEATENLANALLEAHKVTDFNAMKSDLNTYRRYCDRAADLIGDATESAPGAACVLRRGLPIIGERIREIQEKAEALCRETRGTGTPYEPLGRDINKWTRELSDRGYLRDEKDVPRIRDLLGQLCSLLHEDDQDYPCKIVEGIREGRKPEDTLSDIATALSYLVPSIRLQPPIDKTRSDRQPSQKTSHSTTVFAGAYSTVVVPHTETESGDVTVNTAVTEESQPDTQLDRSSKRTAIEISADIAVHVLVYTVLHHFAEDLMSIIAPILVITALITLLLIIRHAKSR